MWKQRIIQAIWILAGAGTIVLLVAAMQKKSAKKIGNEPEVEISGVNEKHIFIDEATVKELLKKKGSLSGVATNKVNLRSIEEALEKDPWIKNAELFFDNQQVLQVKIIEREPVARIFTTGGNSFYLDSSGKVLPLSEKLSARVPVFTGFPNGKKLSAADSLLVNEVITLSNYICADSFWNAQIAQIDIAGNEFEMIPVIGNHIVRFGDVSDMGKKFKKLFSFYKNVSTKIGFDKYEVIDLRYSGQVVAVRRGAVVPVVDSVSAMQQLQQSLTTAARVVTRDTVTVRPTVARPAAAQNATGATRQRQPRGVMRRN